MIRHCIFRASILGTLVCAVLVFQGCSRTISQADFSQEIFVEPGERIQLQLSSGFLFFELASYLPPHWTIEATEGVTINEATGLLQINADVPDGTHFTVTAGDTMAMVYVFARPPVNPLSGNWQEAAQFDCDVNGENVPEHPIREIVFHPSRKFTVTWQPFETYRDYWGSYTLDVEAGTLELNVHGGNYVPDDIDGMGRFQFDAEGALVLEEMWFGTNAFFGVSPGQTPGCGHRLTEHTIRQVGPL